MSSSSISWATASTIAKSTLLTAGAFYLIYKYLWVIEEDDQVGNEEEAGPHWSEKGVSKKKPKPTFDDGEIVKTEVLSTHEQLESTQLSKTEEPIHSTLSMQTPMKKKPRSSISTHTLSEENIYQILAWFDAVGSQEDNDTHANGQTCLSFDILANALVQKQELARVLIEQPNQSELTSSLGLEEIKSALRAIVTETPNFVSRVELQEYLSSRRPVSIQPAPTTVRKSFLQRFSLSPFNFRRYIYNVD